MKRLITALGVFAGVASAHATFLIDDFSTAIDEMNTPGGITLTNVVDVPNGPDVTFLDNNPTPIPGSIGSRFWTLSEPSGAPGTASNLFVSPTGQLNLNFANNPGITASMFSVEYSDFGTSDFTQGGINTAFAVLVTFLDDPINDIDLTVSVESIGGATSSATQSFVGFVLPTNPLPVQISFADLIGTADLTSVTSVTLSVSANSVLAPDLALDAFSVVPEPGAYATIAGVLALGIALLRRRLCTC
ncbi:MAG: hypothetical protein ACFB20_08730 [Opitutales bacterium]